MHLAKNSKSDAETLKGKMKEDQEWLDGGGNG